VPVTAARARLEAESSGLRVLATTREDWSTAQIIEASRARAAGFRGSLHTLISRLAQLRRVNEKPEGRPHK
jgi:hypothetical protein